ncbi:hypothetical protein NDU88_006997 [Pleurodeles waltl]|uniref:Uncharacterized protein n=1 Tax=Pleurodeles waltl TaxID=8319 RepID=A0AAV7NV31_PLEWA|nr:hypothetical protein NDU88_006997 [Pleurodeles waltl]
MLVARQAHVHVLLAQANKRTARSQLGNAADKILDNHTMVPRNTSGTTETVFFLIESNVAAKDLGTANA